MQFIGDNLLFAKESFSDLSPPLVAALALASKGEASAAELSTLGELLETADFEYLQAEVPRALEDARSGINRVAELIRLVKSYSQSDRLELKEADINQSLAQTITLVGAQLTAVAEVKTLFGQLPPVVCHVASLQQAFLHLLTNAVHAIEDVGTGKGVITVETALQQGELVVSIADTGCGIAPAIRDRIFEPFFTTRAVGSGSGQGLPLVRAVVDKHRGRIDVDTEVGRGSTFRVVIPVSGA
jgi:signal transduction histidine kinase